MEAITRNSHFLGAKLRTLRKEYRITLEDLSARLAQIDPLRVEVAVPLRLHGQIRPGMTVEYAGETVRVVASAG